MKFIYMSLSADHGEILFGDVTTAPNQGAHVCISDSYGQVNVCAVIIGIHFSTPGLIAKTNLKQNSFYLDTGGPVSR